MTSNFKSHLADAIVASKNKRILEWTIAYLQNEERNNELLKNIQKRKIVKSELIKYPLSKLNRISGPQNGEIEPEPLTHWLMRVKLIEDALIKKNLPPPIIVTDFWQEMEIADGNHRHEALLKHGFTTYWTIFLFIKPTSAEKFLKNSRITVEH